MGTTLYVIVFTATGATAALKGRWLLFAGGLFLGPALWAISFLLPAKQSSWWFAYAYDDARRARSADAADAADTGIFRRR